MADVRIKVIFGEILPQSICVRYGLAIGGFMSKPVLVLMYLMAPVAWPTAKLLDWLLGEGHVTVYKKSGLKTLVTLHKSLGEVSNRLNQDEVTIISAVLDLKEKPVEQVMTPMEDVFVMSEDTVLDEPMMDLILSAGYSRIPIHEPGNPDNFVGMLLVKILITYDPEDCKRVRDFPLATLPETRPETSCLDIVNFFQEGKSHMVLVSAYPGEDRGSLGVVTLEDVIEELIGEYVDASLTLFYCSRVLTGDCREIIDESDVYVDVHKAIRRLAPAPHARLQRIDSHTETTAMGRSASADARVEEDTEDLIDMEGPRQKSMGSIGAKDDVRNLSSSPKTATFMMRRSSVGVNGRTVGSAVPVRANIDEMREHLKHLGPSNPATNPRDTRSTTVKIKPGGPHQLRTASLAGEIAGEAAQDDGDESTTLLQPKRQSYGSVDASDARWRVSENAPVLPIELDRGALADPADSRDRSTQTSAWASQVDFAAASRTHTYRSDDSGTGSVRSDDSANNSNPPTPRRQYVRSGSITENVVETRGFRKVVLETTSSSDEEAVAESPSRSRTSFLLMTPSSPKRAPEEMKGASKGGEKDEGEDEDSSTAGRRGSR